MTVQLASQPHLPGSKVVGVGHYQPPTVMTNDDIVARGVDTNDEWIQSRVGIAERRFATDDSMIDMAEKAAVMALETSGMTAADVDLVILATCTGEQQVPGGAATLAARLGIKSPGAYDLNAACAGFVYAIAAASSAVTSAQARTVLVVGSEKLTDYVDLFDRSTGIIFADGAGAAVVTSSSEPGIGPVVWGSDGDNAAAISTDRETATLRQEGQTVFRWATSNMGTAAIEACKAAGLTPSELAAFVPHQANLRIIELVAKKLGATNAVIARDIVTSGNTSSASVPIALSKMLQNGEIPSGAPVLLLGFGAGLTYAGTVILAP
ncbi:beta-ketoacyl-ACP synthase III [Jatrophihabitans lederbergiae]|uniref:Beta-ketoacyl-[acyl-carrier-protein] synthase III n=1 Tax=Jatrophihabitans lederbergiae TaxID=3075547 RepID=A0ABU2JCG6_9ACTN|nr:beta-ketoacyl-ACP synthase III [Jatrophihabitans sp. DSM 44399]MDT0262670.1 beta-ketoacyl-ACP synthase III [Jatrophihabitans sp. DSM 44399]